MKFVIFSDIHGNQYALDSFLEKVSEFSFDCMIFCGDIFGYYYGQKSIVRKLSKIKNLIWLKGNHDQYAVDLYKSGSEAEKYIKSFGHCYECLREKYPSDFMQFLEKKTSEAFIETDGKKLAVFHGTPDDSLEGRLYPNDKIKGREEFYDKYEYVILGHTHFRMDRKQGHARIINPGSLGQQRDGLGCGFAVLDTKQDFLEFISVEYDRESLYKEIDFYDKDLIKLKEILERKA